VMASQLTKPEHSVGAKETLACSVKINVAHSVLDMESLDNNNK